MSETTGTGRRGIAADTVLEYSPWEAVKRLLAYVRPYKWMALSAFLLSLTGSGLLVLRPYLVKVAIDSYITTKDISGLGRFMLLFVVVYFIRFAVDYVLTLVTGYMGQYVMHDLRMDVFSHILSMEMGYFDRNRVGRLMTRTTDDVAALNELYTSGAINIINNSAILIGIIAVMFSMDVTLACITLTIIPAVYLVARTFADKIRFIYRTIRRGTARLNAFLQESIQGIRIIQIMRRTAWSYKKFSRYSDDLMDSKVKNVFYYGWFFPAMELIGAIGLILILSAGGVRIQHGTITVGVMIAFIRLIDMLFWPVRELAENFNVMLSAIAASERIFTLLDTKSTITDPKETIGPVAGNEIVFDHVWFAYDGEDWVLKDVTFRVGRGEKVAFAGPSGAGKTSIMSLLMRFYDVNKGRILIDGHDIRDIPLADLRRLIAYVGQEPFLFNRTVRDNIDLGDSTITGERIDTVLDRICAGECFSGLENGLGTVVRERGSRLSQGQRQMVSFSRALAADRRVLVLDEATSSVDTFTESLLQQAIPVLMENRTSIVIAHRLSTIRKVDRIYVISHGSIRETGNHEELMALNGIYAHLSRMHQV